MVGEGEKEGVLGSCYAKIKKAGTPDCYCTGTFRLGIDTKGPAGETHAGLLHT